MTAHSCPGDRCAICDRAIDERETTLVFDPDLDGAYGRYLDTMWGRGL